MKVKNLRIKLKRYLTISMICPVLTAIALVCLIFIDSDKGSFHRIASYIIGATLWLSLICQIVFLIMSGSMRKYIENKMKTTLLKQKCRVGVISFFSSKEAIIADSVFIISAIALIVVIAKDIIAGATVYPILAAVYLSFNMHCFLNGRNYKFLKAYNKFVRERKKV